MRLADAVWSLDDITPGIPSTTLLLADNVSQEQIDYMEAFESEMVRMGNPCEVVTYEYDRSAADPQCALERKYEALANAMDDALQSLGFGSAEQESPS